MHIWAPEIDSFGGGIGAFSRELIRGLSDLGHELQLLSSVDGPGQWGRLPLWGPGDFPRVATRPAFAAGALAYAVRQRPHHIISTHLNFGPVAQIAKRTMGIPFTLVAHGIDVNQGLSHTRRGALRVADRVLAVSDWTRQRLLRLGGIDPSRISILPNTVDEHRFSLGPRPARLLRRYNIKENERVVLSVGRLDRSDRLVDKSGRTPDARPNSRAPGNKGYDRVLQAFSQVLAQCGPVRYVVAGDGDDRQRLESLVIELGLDQAVTFAGFVSADELADHYRLADVFAMPSNGEGFGIVFLEAMSCGIPVLAGNVDGSVDALDGGRLGKLVDPDDVHAISEALIALLGKRGPELWFDKHRLHDAVTQRFGRLAFRETLSSLYLNN